MTILTRSSSGYESFSESNDVPLLDYRHLDQIDSSSFLDDMHLNPDGAIVLSTNLAKDLSVILTASSGDLRPR